MDSSKLLGEYMLSGWVLTDQVCSNSGCLIPLMRTPNGRNPVEYICVSCDHAKSNTSQRSESSRASLGTSISRKSSPQTDITSIHGSVDFELPPESDDSRRRREQVESASTEIGRRLLLGWAMLADECSNVECYGVPLVRPPNSAEKHCVVCGTIYLNQFDGNIPTTSLKPVSKPLPDLKQSTHDVQDTPHPIGEAQLGIQETGKNVLPRSSPPEEGSPRRHPYSNAQIALESCLQALSERLGVLAEERDEINASAVSRTANAISKVAKALAEVHRVQSYVQ